MRASLVVRLTTKDPERPVHLLHEKEPGHRVGEGHAGEGKPQVAPSNDGRGESQVPANYKCQLVLSGQFPIPEQRGQLLA